MKSKKKAFTLIELLAVIIILGVLMLIAIPSVTEYISNSRKKVYLSTASQYISATVAKVNNLDLPISDPNTTYYVPISCINLEKGGKSPYGEWDDAYVVVTTDGTKYDYYWTSLDNAGNAVLLTYKNKLNNNSISASIASLDLSVGVGERSNIVIFDTDGSVLATSSASSNIADGSSLSEGTLAAATDASCFQYEIFDESTFVAWYGASDIEEAEDWLLEDYGLNISEILNGVNIYGYNNMQSDGTTECPTDVVIPNKIEEKNVVFIAYEAFNYNFVSVSNNKKFGELKKLSNTRPMLNESNSSITSIVLPNTLKVIDDNAFEDNQLTSLIIPSSVEYIGSEAFKDNQLTSLIIPSTVKYIGSDAFEYNQLQNLTIENGVTYIGGGAFNDNLLTTVSIPSSLKNISNFTFDSNSLTTITIPEGVERVGAGAFINNSITAVTLPSTLTFLCDEAFDPAVTISPTTPTWSTGCCNCSE